jgi:hypothetical protein
MIFVAIFGLWKYIAVPMWKDVAVPLWNWWNRSFTLTEKLILLALLALAGYLSWQVFLALIVIDPAFHVLLARLMSS